MRVLQKLKMHLIYIEFVTKTSPVPSCARFQDRAVVLKLVPPGAAISGYSIS